MATRDHPWKSARATTSEVDLEPGDRGPEPDQITPSGSSRRTPEEDVSNVSKPKLRGSLQLDDGIAHAHPSRSIGVRTLSKLELAIPRPVTRISNKIAHWVRGPEPSQILKITPFFERAQTLPLRLLARLPRWLQLCIFGVTCVLWIVIFGVVISDYSLPTNIGGFGAPARLSCVANLWPSPQSCGLDGRNCLPFSNSSFAFNCPAGCLTAQVLNPRSIGAQIINYRSLVVGGTPDNEPIYRGDSFICAAAIHAGVTTNSQGGCGVVSLLGNFSSYGSAVRNGISSVPFDTSFPMSFAFDRTSSASTQCRDPRWNLLALSIIFTALFGLFTASPSQFFFPVFTILFFQTGMASDPPSYTTYASLASTTLGRFLPAILAATLLYHFAVYKTLLHCRASIEKTVLWVGGAWVGALANYTFERIPLQRLTGHDIRQQPGALTALIIIVLVIFLVAVYQIWCFRLQGRLPRYLALYVCLGLGLGVLAAMPSLNLRIHHYILALLLLPGTAMQTRLSLLAQGLLVGLFVNGIARWGFAPVLETGASLRGDAQLGSGTPRLLEPLINGTSITFVWEGLLRGYHGVSVLVNDVERYRGGGNVLGSGGSGSNFTWTRQVVNGPEYLRFGFVNYRPFGGVSYSDFTRAGTWWENGTWSGIPAGRTGY